MKTEFSSLAMPKRSLSYPKMLQIMRNAKNSSPFDEMVRVDCAVVFGKLQLLVFPVSSYDFQRAFLIEMQCLKRLVAMFLEHKMQVSAVFFPVAVLEDGAGGVGAGVVCHEHGCYHRGLETEHAVAFVVRVGFSVLVDSFHFPLPEPWAYVAVVVRASRECKKAADYTYYIYSFFLFLKIFKIPSYLRATSTP